MDLVETIIVAFAGFLLVGGSIAYLSTPRAPLEEFGAVEDSFLGPEPGSAPEPASKADGREGEDDDDGDDDDDRPDRQKGERGKGKGKD